MGQPRPGIDRRQLLLGGAAAAAAWPLAGVPLVGAAGRSARHLPLSVLVDPAGTTLQATVARAPGDGYRRLVEGPGQPLVVRDELGAPRSGREDRRRPLAAVVQFSDTHLVDAQSPGRVELLDRMGGPFTAAWRPQEALSTQVVAAMVGHVNGLARGPVTGRPFDALVCTGDNTDNGQVNELDWFVGVLDGGRLTPDSGARGTYEGVQDGVAPDPAYWHPDGAVADTWKADRGFPAVDGLLADAIAPFDAPALAVPWWATYGNHDGLLQGNVAPSDPYDTILVGDRKITGLPPGVDSGAFVGALFSDPAGVAATLAAGGYLYREVTPDEERRSALRPDWIRRMLASPTGHGYVDDDLDATKTWYRFAVAEGVVGISLDTCAHGGSASGCITEGQLRWLEAELASLHSAHLAADGSVVRTGGDDQLVLVFSHHTSTTMDADSADPAFPDERRVQGEELVATLLRYPNVVAWVNGHTHTHGIAAHRDPAGLTPGFWEVTTASHIDFPQQSRVLELVDNGDGTHSLFGVVIDHDAPLVADPTDRSLAGLVAISRELSANDPQGHSAAFSDPAVFNVELVRPAPAVGGTRLSPPTTAARSAGTDARGSGSSDDGGIGLAGVGGALLVGGAAVGAAVALRRRRDGTRAGATTGAGDTADADGSPPDREP